MPLEFLLPSELSEEVPLARFFESLAESGATEFFNPHPMTSEEALQRLTYEGDDYYLLALREGEVLGYGFLRWAPGFPRPSLGVAVRQSAEGKGLGRALMEALHAEARFRGCAEVRLRVHLRNTRAQLLYESLGYVWQPELERGERVGIKRLSR